MRRDASIDGGDLRRDAGSAARDRGRDRPPGARRRRHGRHDRHAGGGARARARPRVRRHRGGRELRRRAAATARTRSSSTDINAVLDEAHGARAPDHRERSWSSMAIRAGAAHGRSAAAAQKSRPVEAVRHARAARAARRTCRTRWRALNGAGLAAPQIGVGLQRRDLRRRIQPALSRTPRTVPYTVLINPELEPLGDEMEEGWEGCLSVPGHARPGAALTARCAIAGFDRARQADRPRRWRVSTRAWCSTKCDHLDGILYPMRIRDFRASASTRSSSPAQDLPAED